MLTLQLRPSRVATVVTAATLLALLGAGCSCATPRSNHTVDGNGRDAGTIGDDTGVPRDANFMDTPLVIPDAYIVPDPNAFFAMDPPPAVCYPDGGMGPRPNPPGGTPECPDDRARAGCRCVLNGVTVPLGTTAPCWEGHRRNRMRGSCHDGIATCEAHDEFGGAWGACTGQTLPTPGATRGPGACQCFSAGRWQIDNLSPCFVGPVAAHMNQYYAVSTYLNGTMPSCPAATTGPPFHPQAGTTWSTNSLMVDCTGQFTLCYTLRAGSATNPLPTDCMVAQSCVTAWYATPGAMQALPNLPAWEGTNPTCATQFATSGGYGEMSVQGHDGECDDVGNGTGGPFVFNRVNYCPLINPPAGCSNGGSGMF